MKRNSNLIGFLETPYINDICRFQERKYVNIAKQSSMIETGLLGNQCNVLWSFKIAARTNSLTVKPDHQIKDVPSIQIHGQNKTLPAERRFKKNRYNIDNYIFQKLA